MTKIGNSISVAEMLHMWEVEGLSNTDIAKRLDISNATVYAYIGKQPSGMRKPWGSNRKKDELPALPENTEVPEMPRESFAERCERLLGKPEPADVPNVQDTHKSLFTEALEAERENLRKCVKKMVNDTFQPLAVVEDIEKSTADVAREAHKRNLPKMATADTEDRTHIPELIAVFGQDAVIAWLKVSLYDMGIPDCRPMNRQKMLETLKNMNAGGANT